jgi:hypothetical protein
MQTRRGKGVFYSTASVDAMEKNHAMAKSARKPEGQGLMEIARSACGAKLSSWVKELLKTAARP